MKNIFVFCFLVCMVLVCLSQSSEAYRRKKHSRDLQVDQRSSHQNQRMRGGGMTRIERQERRRNQMKRKGALKIEGHQHSRRMKKIKERFPNLKGKNFRLKNRRKQRKNRRKHPLRLHRTKKVKPVVENITELVQIMNVTETDNTSIDSFNQTDEITLTLQEDESATTVTPITHLPTGVYRKTIVGGSNSPCVSTSDCLPGHCCITKPNKGSRCKKFEAPAGKKCWDTCMCANGMDCFVKNRHDYGKHRRIRKKGKKQKGVCKIPETDDVIKGIILTPLAATTTSLNFGRSGNNFFDYRRSISF